MQLLLQSAARRKYKRGVRAYEVHVCVWVMITILLLFEGESNKNLMGVTSGEGRSEFSPFHPLLPESKSSLEVLISIPLS